MFRLKMAYLNLLRNRRRSLLSALLVAIAVVALLLAGGFGLFTYQSLQEAAARDTGHLIVSQPGFFAQEEEYPLQNGLEGYQTLRKQLLADSRVKAVQPRIEFSGLISNGEKSSIFVGQGIDAHEFTLKGPFLDLQAGSLLSAKEDPADPQILLGIDLAKNLRVEPGDYITLLSTTAAGALNAVDYRVQGLVSLGVPELDKRQVFVSLTSAQFLLDADRVSYLSIFAYDTGDSPTLLNQFQARYESLQVTPWWIRAFFYEKVKDLYDRIFGVMGAIMAIVIYIALFNTLAMSVTERTREIGMLGALGAAPGELTLNFILEGFLLALTGAVIGCLLAGLTSLGLLFLDIQMPPPPGRSVGYPLHITFSATLALVVSLATISICVAASWIAARKGVNKPITEALVYV